MFISCLPKDSEVYLLNSTETMAWGRNKRFFTELCNGVLQGKELFIDPERHSNHNQTLSIYNPALDLWYLFRLRLLPTCEMLSVNDHHLTRKDTHVLF